MKNKFAILLVTFVVLAVALGCSYSFDSNSSSEKPKAETPNDKPKTEASNTQGGNTNTADSAKTGVKECDEFLDMISADSKATDENFVTRKLREAATDFAKEQVRQSIEDNKGDKEKIAAGCREAREEYIKDKAAKETK